MSTHLQKIKIIECFRLFNNSLSDLLSVESIEQKFPMSRSAYVDYQSQQLYYKLDSDIRDEIALEQIVIELDNSLTLIKGISAQLTNKQLAQSTKSAIRLGCKYITSKLTPLRSEMAEKLSQQKSKTKSKFDDIKISEKEFALFILLATKYGLISNAPKANDKAAALSTLTNISEQSLRECIGSKYQLNPQELLLKKENLTILKETLLNICTEIELFRINATY